MASFDLAAELAAIREFKEKKKTKQEGGEKEYDLVICTDGACTKNGKEGALAGVGVFFGDNDPRNISEALQGDVQTNNRAELTAFIYALQHTLINASLQVHIQSDSKYCVDGYKSWIYNWASNKWRTSSGSTVKNKDLWEQVWVLKGKMHDLVVTPHVTWVRGHDGHAGNEAADQLAVQGITFHPGYIPPKPRKSLKKSASQKKPEPPSKRKHDSI